MYRIGSPQACEAFKCMLLFLSKSLDCLNNFVCTETWCIHLEVNFVEGPSSSFSTISNAKYCQKSEMTDFL